MNKEDYMKVVKFCAKGKCKPRENSYGVLDAVNCMDIILLQNP